MSNRVGAAAMSRRSGPLSAICHWVVWDAADTEILELNGRGWELLRHSGESRTQDRYICAFLGVRQLGNGSVDI